MDSSQAYEANADEFLRNRERSSIGSDVVKKWAESLNKNAEVLELACGGGYPVTAELRKAGLNLWAIDGSETLLSTFSSRFPDVQTCCETLQKSTLFNRQFDAVIAIGILFLLPEKDQRALINKVSKVLKSKGRFLFTAPIEAGKWNDLSTGVKCHSLGLDEYTHILNTAGFTILSMVVDSGGNNHFDVRKNSF